VVRRLQKKGNEPQPDIVLRILPECGGQSRATEDDTIEGAPELCIEVAGSAASYDLHGKLEAYRRNGVREYIVWRTYDGKLDWFALRDGVFVPLAPDSGGILQSEAFPGLRLDVPALLRDDMTRVLAVLGQGVVVHTCECWSWGNIEPESTDWLWPREGATAPA
jgi:Uma2 family endonuclease